jgi:hypothetical protein
MQTTISGRAMKHPEEEDFSFVGEIFQNEIHRIFVKFVGQNL